MDNSETRAINFLEKTLLGIKDKPKTIKDCIIFCLGNQQHLWMWDYITIKNELKKVGFKNIRRAYFNDSIDNKFNEIESRGRWENCLGVECIKG